MARRGYGSEVSVGRYDDRRDYDRGGRRYDDRYFEEDIEYRSRGPPARDRERNVGVKEEVIERERTRSPPAFLREDYGRTTAGPMVLRAREREDFEFAPRRRSPSPEPERKKEREEIIIRRDESEHSRPPPRPRERSREREEIIIRRDEADDVRSVAPSRRGDERDREEIIIRREERDRGRDYGGRPGFIEDDRYARRVDDYQPSRPMSHERERSRHRRGSESEQEIIIRREDREGGRRGDVDRQEIIIRKQSRSPSPSSVSTRGPALAPDPPVVRAPPIHQEIITHHRHIDHGFEVASRPRPISRPPSPPMPPPPRGGSEERIEIHRSGEKNGRPYDEDIVIDRNEGARPRSPMPPPRDPYYDYLPPRREREPPPPGALMPYRGGYDRDVGEEADYYNSRAMERAYPGEAYHGATRDWGIVDVPPGTRRVRMDGAGGGEQEITWQRYNGVRRSKFYPDGPGGGELSPRPMPPPAPGGQLGGRYGRPPDPREGLWTEITKDLVVKEAIKDMGYEFEETDDFYYVIAYLQYEDVARLVGLSDDIRKARRTRAREMEWENRAGPEPFEDRPRLAIEGPPPRRDDRRWDREDDRYIEREIVYRGGRPPPPPGWRR